MASNAELLYLPPYSLDLNPIKQTFSKIKNEFRKRKLHTKEEYNAICKECMDRFTLTQCRDYIGHAGYRYGLQDRN